MVQFLFLNASEAPHGLGRVKGEGDGLLFLWPHLTDEGGRIGRVQVYIDH